MQKIIQNLSKYFVLSRNDSYSAKRTLLSSIALIATFIFATVSFSQTTTCNTATVITAVNAASCTPVTTFNISGTGTGPAMSSCFTNGTVANNWGQFVANGTTATISYVPAGGRDAMIYAYSGTCPSGLTEIGCIDVYGNGGQEDLALTSLTPGATYYFRIVRYGSTNSMNGKICIASANSISTGSIAGSPFCAGNSLSVPFTSYGIYSGNTYTAQLSNAAGSFGSPVSIGTLVSNLNSGTVSATIPPGTVTGSGYRIRVISSGPSVTGNDNGANLAVVAATVTLSSTAGTNAQILCNGTAITNITYAVGGTATGAGVIGLPTGITGAFSAGVFTISGTPTANGTFNYTVTTTGGSCSAATATGTITVNGLATITLSSSAGTNAQTVCNGTAITNITYSVAGTATGAGVTGLPTGLTGSFSTGVFTISGTPTANGTFNYTVTTTGGSCSVTATGTITIVVASVTLSSSAGTNAQTVCNGTAITNITYSVAGTATGAGVSALPTGVTGSFSTGVFTISGTPTANGTFNYTVTTTGGSCTAATSTGTITVNGLATIALSSAIGTNTQTLCNSNSITNITYSVGGTATGAGVSGLPTGVTGSFSAGVFTISGTPTANGTFIYTVTTTGGSCPVTATGTISVNGLPTVTLTSAVGTNAQTLCNSTAITNITYSVGGTATGAGISSLPTGVTGSFSAGVFTISGTPSANGTFNYTVTTTGGSCTAATASGTITVNGLATITLSSVIGTNTQTLCNSNSITNITYSVGGTATGAGVSGLPTGVTGSFSAGVFTISGTPTVNGTFNYTVTTTGGSCAVTATGTITVNGLPTIALTSAVGTNAQTLCNNTAITNITYSVGGTGTGAGVIGLPTGVTGSFSAGVFTISGTPTANGTFNYTVTTTGGSCTAATATGTITVNGLATITRTSAAATTAQTVCNGTAITNITYSVGGTGTGAGVSGLPTGVTGSFSAGVFTISGTPTANGTFNYTVTTTGGSCPVTANGTITVVAATLTLSSAAATLAQTVCNSTAIANITYSVGGTATGAGVSGLPAGVTGSFSAGVFNISGTPTANGTFNYTVTTTGGSCTAATATGTITVNGLATITRTSAAATTAQTVCNGTAITNITYSVGGTGTGAGVSGLPTGVTGSFSAGVFTINGTPTANGTFNYTVTTTGGSCTVIATGTITANTSTVTLSSAVATAAQTLCNSTAITNITYTVGGTATSAGVSGLPTGVTGSFSAGVFSISGTPTANGTFNYTVTTTGGSCTAATATGTITVNALPTVTISANYCLGGGAVRLTCSAQTSYLWSTGATAPFIDVTTAGTYSVTGTNAGGCSATANTSVATELVTNGNFSSGNTGFTTLYNYNTNLVPEGNYYVGSNANTYHTGFYCNKDHTTASGNFMIVNGSPVTQQIWQQTVTVVPNTTYYFSAWATSMNAVAPYAQLQFSVNSAQVGTVATLPAGASSNAGPFTWYQFYGTWNSGSNTTAVINVIDLQTALGGNDFGLDDISFSTLSPVSIAVAPSTNSPVCAGNALNISANLTGGSSPFTYSWAGPSSYSSSSQNPVIPSAVTANAGVYSLTITDGYGCTASGSTSSVIVNGLPTVTLSSAAGTNAQTLCNSTALTNITYSVGGTATGAGVSGLPTGVTGLFSAGVFTISGTPTANGTFNYTVTTTGGSCTAATATGTITVNGLATISRTSAAATTAQTVCKGTAITNITYSVGGTGIGAGVSGLPTGVTGSFGAGVFTISGTPTANGTFNYTVTTTGGSCPVTATGTISVVSATITLSSAVATAAQTLCNSTAITNITYTVGGTATGAGVSGLPTGVTGSFSAGVFTISGTPTANGTFNYTVTTTGGSCTAATATGTITVNGLATITRTSAAATTAQTVCNGTAITNITYSVGGTGTGAGVSGLPTGVNGSFSAGVFTISGTPAANGTFNYTVTTTGGSCPATATGSITVNGLTTITRTSALATTAQTVCNSTVITNITYSVGGTGTGAGVSGLPTGVTGSFSAGVYTISGTPTANGTFNYTVTTTGGSCPVTASGTITVNALPIDITPTAAATNVCTGNSTNIQITASQSGVTYQLRNNSGNINIGSNVAGTGGTISLPTGFLSATSTFNVLASNSVSGCALQMTNTVTVTVSSTGQWVGGASGDWNTAANWCGGVPTSTSNISIPAGSTINIQSANAVVNSVNIAATGSLVMTGAYNLSISSGGTFTNNGTFTATGSTGTVVFLGSGTISGITTFKNIDTYGALNFGAASTIAGTFSIQTGGSVTGNSPNYTCPSSSLLYKPGSVYTRGLEWTTASSGAGYPANVLVQNNTTINFPAVGNGFVCYDVQIEAGSSIQQNYSGGSASLSVGRNITINGTLTLGGSTGGDISLGGNWTRNTGGIFTHNDRKVTFDGPTNFSGNGTAMSTITAPASATKNNEGGFGGENFAHLWINKTNTTDSVVLVSNITVNRELGFTRGTFSLRNSDVTLVSNSTRTADIAPVATIANISIRYGGTGKFVVQRFIQNPTATRSWRLLTAPLQSATAPSINEAFMEGVVNPDKNNPNGSGGIYNPWPGYGTHITGPGGLYSAANGFDQGTTSASILYGGPGVSTWLTPSSTLSTKITDQQGWMLFVRGDRSFAIGNQYMPSANAILEPKGRINVGDISVPVAAGRKVIGNPYPSAISLLNVDVSGISGGQSSYHLWDPKMFTSFTQPGKWVSFTGLGSSFVQTTSASSYLSNGTIESGQAFLLDVSAPGTITFHESDKLALTSSLVGISNATGARPMSQPLFPLFRSDIYAKNDTAYRLTDGVLNIFNSSFNNAATDEDAKKMISFNTKESLSILRDGVKIAIEKRSDIQSTDTIFFAMSKFNELPYRFRFEATDFTPGYEAFLEDKFTGDRLQISTAGVSEIDFEITANPLSKAEDRFRVVFKSPFQTVLPVTFTSVKAWQQNKNIAVQWKVANEINIKEYEVEKSVDGISFTKVNNTLSQGSFGGNYLYSWLDENAVAGDNYYRIKSNDINEKLSYSEVVKVRMANSGGSINVYPNPVADGIIKLYFKNMDKGNYSLRLLNATGQTIASTSFLNAGAVQLKEIKIAKGIAKGLYQIEVAHPGSEKSFVKVIIE